MDMEKYTTSKLYLFFEWLFKLIVWNVLTMIITLAPLLVPLFICFRAIPSELESVEQILEYAQTQSTLFTVIGIFIIIGLLLSVFIFIPAYVTIFCLIKIQYEGSAGNAFLFYFDRFWDNVKALYKLELIIIPVVTLFILAMSVYYMLLGQDGFEYNAVTIWYSIGYNMLLVALLILVLCFLNLPMVIGYFRMKTKTIMRFTLIITFKQILNTIIYFLLILMPILLILFVPVLFPVWFLLGLSFPLYLMYFLSAQKYRQLVKNLDTIKEDDIYDIKGDNNETRN